MIIVTKAILDSAPNYNESEVRFHLLDPLVRSLGYPEKENTYIYLEKQLEYPYIHVGHRSKKDLPVGYPDYRVGLKGGKGSFIVEAKTGSKLISSIDIEQAHSYAAHAQVGAKYFVLCSGLELRIYETLSGTGAKPIVSIKMADINDRFHEIEAILSPSNLRKHSKIEYDLGLRLCDGLGSSVVFRSGTYNVSATDFKILINGEDYTPLLRESVPQLAELDRQLEMFKTIFELRLAEGRASRDENGQIVAFVRFAGVTAPNAAAMKMTGLDHTYFTTAEKFLSLDASVPTMFESTKDFSVDRGALIPETLGGETLMMADVKGEVYIRAAMSFNGNAIQGQYLSMSDYFFEIPPFGKVKAEMNISGSFIISI